MNDNIRLCSKHRSPPPPPLYYNNGKHVILNLRPEVLNCVEPGDEP